MRYPTESLNIPVVLRPLPIFALWGYRIITCMEVNQREVDELTKLFPNPQEITCHDSLIHCLSLRISVSATYSDGSSYQDTWFIIGHISFTNSHALKYMYMYRLILLKICSDAISNLKTFLSTSMYYHFSGSNLFCPCGFVPLLGDLIFLPVFLDSLLSAGSGYLQTELCQLNGLQVQLYAVNTGTWTLY